MKQSPEMLSSPRSFEKLDDRVTKSSPNLTKFCRHDHKGLVNTSTEGIDKSLHGLGGIEEIPSKNGVFSRTQKHQFEGACESEGFSTRLEGLGTPPRSHENNKNQLLTLRTRIDNENRNSTKQGTKRKGLRRDQNPGGHNEGRASFPDQFTYKVFTNPWLKS